MKRVIPTIWILIVVLLCTPLMFVAFPLQAAQHRQQGMAATGSWQPTGSMQTGRAWQSATRLADGRVLVAGGSPSSWGSTVSSAEIYDPATATWSATGSMTQGRFLHSATLLPNGKVLVAGGEGPSWLKTAELYDPSTGTWSATGSMQQARSMHSATLLPNGKVLVAGGYGLRDIESAELYDPSTGTWSATGSMKQARMHHPAVLLPDGKVLVCGGTIFAKATYPPLASTEIYDPATGQWSDTANLNDGRHNHQAILLKNGQVLAIAGSGATSAYVLSAELYDPATGLWTRTGALQEPHAHVLPLAVMLPGGEVMISGGYNQLGEASALTEIYDPATGAWTRAADMTSARYEHAMLTLQDGSVLSIGGFKGVNSAEIYRFPASAKTYIFLPMTQR